MQRLIRNVNQLLGFDQWRHEDVEQNIQDLEQSISEYFSTCFQHVKKILSQIYEHKIPYNLIEDITQKNLLLLLKNTLKELEARRSGTSPMQPAKLLKEKDTSGFIKKQTELR